MVIREFAFTSFRNYDELLIDFSDKINIFIGNNGQGKSNLAEGIYFLSHLDSFRTHRPKKLIQFGQPISQIQATIAKGGISHKARIEISGKGRKVWLDEFPIRKLSEYITSFYAIVFNPDSLHFFRHIAGERRAFFNRFLSFFDSMFLYEIREFRSVHAQKNRLLKTGAKSSLLDWNVLFVEKGCDIVKKRQEMVERINAVLPELYARVSGRQARLLLEYRPSIAGEPAACLKLLEKAAYQEFQAGHALHGPHRDDFHLTLAEGHGDEFFSQGEYRISLLALKLAINLVMTERMQFHPVLILDDLFSELDETVRTNLRAYLFQVPNQIFITSTEPREAHEYPDPRIMEIRAGQIV